MWIFDILFTFLKNLSVSSLILGNYSNVKVNFIGVKDISEWCSAEHQPEIVNQISTFLKWILIKKMKFSNKKDDNSKHLILWPNSKRFYLKSVTLLLDLFKVAFKIFPVLQRLSSNKTNKLVLRLNFNYAIDLKKSHYDFQRPTVSFQIACCVRK